MIVKPIVVNELKATYCGVQIDLVFNDNLTIVSGDSGTGKSFLYSALTDLVLDYPFLYPLNYTSKGKDLAGLFSSSKGKLFVIDNADLLLGDKERECIAFDCNNQYLLFGRNPAGLMITYNNVKELSIVNKVTSFVD